MESANKLYAELLGSLPFELRAVQDISRNQSPFACVVIRRSTKASRGAKPQMIFAGYKHCWISTLNSTGCINNKTTMIKAYTDLEQSKRLAEFLPLDSADMEYLLEHWIDEKTGRYRQEYYEIPVIKVEDDGPLQPITHPCWSLAALYDILPDEIEDNGDIYRIQLFHLKAKNIVSYPRLTTIWPIFLQEEGDSSVDACYKMIMKLHKQKLI